MRQTLTDDFWGLHKNINCAFPLNHFHWFSKQIFISKEIRYINSLEIIRIFHRIRIWKMSMLLIRKQNFS